ncbi:MAG TPA: phosphoribosylformylglycinamidine synthase subunit PurS [Bryobacteraceae bacterium]|nr:phosphoribosylformylglycinamidine synthase subunit PurS [Bryobacteraceae bacterium]
MRARVFVTLKTTVLDPQGQTIRAALQGLGYPEIEDVRQGKYFEIAIGNEVAAEKARKDIETIAQDVLTNPVIEDYRIEVLD